MKDEDGIERNVDQLWWDHFQWRAPIWNTITSEIDLLDPHGDPYEYEFSFNFVFPDKRSACDALIECDLLEDAIAENWILCHVHMTTEEVDLKALRKEF